MKRRAGMREDETIRITQPLIMSGMSYQKLSHSKENQIDTILRAAYKAALDTCVEQLASTFIILHQVNGLHPCLGIHYVTRLC